MGKEPKAESDKTGAVSIWKCALAAIANSSVQPRALPLAAQRNEWDSIQRMKGRPGITKVVWM